MKQYTDKDTAPLLFHTFNYMIRIPFSIITVVVGMFTSLQYTQHYELAGWVTFDWLYGVAMIASAIILYRGLSKLTNNCFYAILCFEWIYVIYAALAFLLVSNQKSAATLLGGLITGTLISFYYYKRRLLFTDPYAPKNDNIECCTICGATKIVNATFCNKCGTQLNSHRGEL